MIKTKKKYEKALAKIEKLMDAEPNTPEFAKLEKLILQVEVYEDACWPIAEPSERGG